MVLVNYSITENGVSAEVPDNYDMSDKEFNKKVVEECSAKCGQLIESKMEAKTKNLELMLSFLSSIACLGIYFYNKCGSKKNSIDLENFKEFVKKSNFDNMNLSEKIDKNEILDKLSKLEKISLKDIEESEELMKIFNLYSGKSK